MTTHAGKARPLWLQELLYVLVAVLAGFGVAATLNHFLDGAVVERTERDLARTLEHFSPQVLDVLENGADPSDLLQREAEVLGVRLTLIASDGRVLADSHVERRRLAQVENHGTRPEVLAARAAKVGFDRRLSATVAEPFVYVAYRLDRGGTMAGYLRGAVSEREIYRAEAPFRSRLLAVSCLTGLLAGLLILSIRRRHSGELQLLRDSIRRASRGESPHATVQTSADAAEILASVADLVRRVTAEEARAYGHERMLEAILETLPDGVLVTREDLSIVTSNSAAAALLGTRRESLVPGAHVLEAYRDARLSRAFEAAFSGGGESEAILEAGGSMVRVRVESSATGPSRYAIGVLTRA